jgi:hypothetical protein
VIELQPGETVFFPAPFVEGERHRVMITNRRVAQLDGERVRELPAREVTFVGRLSRRPRLALGIAVALVGLALGGAGAWLWIASRSPNTGAPAPATPRAAAPIADDPAGAAQSDGADDWWSWLPRLDLPALPRRPLAIGLAAAGALLLLVGALVALRRRHEVLVRAGEALLRIPARSPVEQTQLLATLQAVREAARDR